MDKKDWTEWEKRHADRARSSFDESRSRASQSEASLSRPREDDTKPISALRRELAELEKDRGPAKAAPALKPGGAIQREADSEVRAQRAKRKSEIERLLRDQDRDHGGREKPR